MKRTAYIDCDIICYKAGFASQDSEVRVTKNGRYVGTWKNKTEAKTSLSVDSLDGFEVEQIITPEPVQNCLRTVKIMLKKYTIGAQCDQYKAFLDGEGNFRADVATILPYKGNRVTAKPVHYNAIREYLIKYHKAKTVRMIESDDMLSIAQYQNYLKNGDSWGKAERVIVTIDKDAKNTPGWLYNPDKDTEPQFIDELSAAKSFFCQLVTGDKVDNIQGMPGEGAKSHICKQIEQFSTPRQMYDRVLEGYERASLGLTGLQENAKLLWMLRHMPKTKDELYVPWTFEDHFNEEIKI